MAQKRPLDDFERDNDVSSIEDADSMDTVVTDSAPQTKRLKTDHDSFEQDMSQKRKYDLYKLDDMEQDVSDAKSEQSEESELQYPRISTPDSVKYPRFNQDSDDEPEDLSQTTLVDPWPVDEDQFYDVIDEYDLSDEEDRFIRQLEQQTPPPKMIRKKTAYGVVSVPQSSNEEEEYITTDEEDDEEDAIEEETPQWNEREKHVFLLLVCDYGRNWQRFLPFFPHMSRDDMQDHFNYLVAEHPDWGLEEVADAADEGAPLFVPRPAKRYGRWAHSAMGSDRLVLGGSAIQPDYVMPPSPDSPLQ